MEIIIVTQFLAIVILHYVADFIFQAESWATNKSKSMKALLSHTITYSLVVFAGIVPIFYSFGNWNLFGAIAMSFLFAIITFICHTTTDYFTSRVVSRMFREKKYGSPIPNFGAFSIIGFDQVLHYTQLFLTYYLLI